MSTNTLPIVGMFHRPPAQALVDVLAIGTPLYLLAEPTNNFDPNAIQVFFETKHLTQAMREALEEKLPPFGFDIDMIEGQEAWHLGYIPKNFAAQLKETETVVDNQPINVTFSTNPKGDPRVRFDQEVL